MTRSEARHRQPSGAAAARAAALRLRGDGQVRDLAQEVR
jgi:hypothetical protein